MKTTEIRHGYKSGDQIQGPHVPNATFGLKVTLLTYRIELDELNGSLEFSHHTAL